MQQEYNAERLSAILLVHRREFIEHCRIESLPRRLDGCCRAGRDYVLSVVARFVSRRTA
jgi:hypothetical protein